MPRFTKAQHDRIKAILLDRAVQLFAERPYTAVTVEDVTAAAGIAKGTFYSFFASKEELFSQAFGREHERFHRRFRDLFEGIDVCRREDVRAALHAGMRDLAASPLLLRVLGDRDTPVWLKVQADPAGQMAQEQENTDVLAGLIRAGQQAGVMRTGDPLELTEVVSQLLAGLLISGVVSPSDVFHRIETALDLMVDGLYTVDRGEGR